MLLTFLSNTYAQTDWDRVAELRRKGDYSKAERILKNYSSPSGFDQLKASEKIKFMHGLLELAHVKALKNDVSGSLALLNWAASQKDDYLRAIALCKYGEILIEMNELERAKAYLKDLQKILRRHSTQVLETGTAFGQGSERFDTAASWRLLNDDVQALRADIEGREMEKKFGKSYGKYVQLRFLEKLLEKSQNVKYRSRALKIADEIIQTDPKSQFAAAATYIKGKILFSQLGAKKYGVEIKDVKNYLEKAASDNKNELYSGELYMLLGKLALEQEWDAKEAENYYGHAYKIFKKTREQQDALSLYSPIEGELKQQTKPTQKTTTLNQWFRIVFHAEDPFKIYNVANAPIWYIDDKERSCIYALGFLEYANGNYDKAKNYWQNILNLSPDIAKVDQRLPNVQSRLLQACRVKGMLFWPEEKAGIKDKKLRLYFTYAELLYLLERFTDAKEIFVKIAKQSNQPETKATAYMGIAKSIEMEFKDNSKTEAEKYVDWILKQTKLKKAPIYGKALYFSALLKNSTNKRQDAIEAFQQYLKSFPKGRYNLEIKRRMGMCYLSMGELSKAEKFYEGLRGKHEFYAWCLKDSIDKYKKARSRLKPGQKMSDIDWQRLE
jgi:tetratricopeptide (TPR) repeat protein